MNNDAYLIQRLAGSNLFREFKQAFAAGTGLPLTLRPVTYLGLAHRGQTNENSFCALIAETSRGCSACLETEQRAVDAAQVGPATVRCFAGLCHSAIPVNLGGRILGYLLTGQVAYAVGFQSLTHFNRLFRALTGESPTRFRDERRSWISPTARNVNARSCIPEGHPARTLRLAA